MESSKTQPWFTYTVVERDSKKYWVKVGIAYRNRDGSYNIKLDAVPVNGTLHIRERAENSAEDRMERGMLAAAR